MRSALVNGTAGVVADTGGRLLAVMGFTVRRGKILEIDILADPARLRSTYQSRTPDADPDPAMTSLRTTRVALHRAARLHSRPSALNPLLQSGDRPVEIATVHSGEDRSNERRQGPMELDQPFQLCRFRARRLEPMVVVDADPRQPADPLPTHWRLPYRHAEGVAPQPLVP